MSEILLFEDVKFNTDWDYKTTYTQLKKSGCKVSITGGRWLIVSRTFRTFLGLLEHEFQYFYDITFEKREPTSKVKSITKLYSNDFEEKHGLHNSEKIFPLQDKEKVSE